MDSATTHQHAVTVELVNWNCGADHKMDCYYFTVHYITTQIEPNTP